MWVGRPYSITIETLQASLEANLGNLPKTRVVNSSSYIFATVFSRTLRLYTLLINGEIAFFSL